jgi:hypothetical protein
MTTVESIVAPGKMISGDQFAEISVLVKAFAAE